MFAQADFNESENSYWTIIFLMFELYDVVLR